MSAAPDFILTIEFYPDRIETYAGRPGTGHVMPEIVSAFLRQIADQIDQPDATTLAAVLHKHLGKAE